MPKRKTEASSNKPQKLKKTPIKSKASPNKKGKKTTSSEKYDSTNRRIELPLSAAEQIADFVDVQVQLVEVHPTHERLEVSVVNLNENR